VKDKNRLYSMDELVSMFKLEKAKIKSTKIEPGYLDKYNKQCMTQMMENSALMADLPRQISLKMPQTNSTMESESLDDTYLRKILDKYLSDERVTTLTQLLTNPDHAFLWSYQTSLHPDLLRINEKTPAPREMATVLEQLLGEFGDRFSRDSEEYTIDNIKKFLDDFERSSGVNHRITLPYIRLLVTHSKKGLPIGEMFYLLGKERTIARLKHGIGQMKSVDEAQNIAPMRSG